MIDINTIDLIEVIPGFRGRFVHTDAMNIAFWEVDAEVELPLHSHHHTQTTQVVEGELEFEIGEETEIYTSGKMVVIKSMIEHRGRAITDCKLIDTFTPVREDHKALSKPKK